MRSAVATLTLVLALAAGCGDDDTTTVDAGSTIVSEARYYALATEVGKQLADLPRVSGSPEVIAESFDAKADDVADQFAALEGLTPPSIVASEHERLLEVIPEIEGLCREVATAASAGDEAAANAAVDSLNAALGEAQVIFDEMDAETPDS